MKQILVQSLYPVILLNSPDVSIGQRLLFTRIVAMMDTLNNDCTMAFTAHDTR